MTVNNAVRSYPGSSCPFDLIWSSTTWPACVSGAAPLPHLLCSTDLTLRYTYIHYTRIHLVRCLPILRAVNISHPFWLGILCIRKHTSVHSWQHCKCFKYCKYTDIFYIRMLHCHIFIGWPVEIKESKGLTAVNRGQLKVLLFFFFYFVLFFYFVTIVAG